MAWLITITSQRGNTTYCFTFLPRFITRRIKNQNEDAAQSYYLKYNKKYKISKKSENWIFYETKKKRFIVRSFHREHSMLYAEMTCKHQLQTIPKEPLFKQWQVELFWHTYLVGGNSSENSTSTFCMNSKFDLVKALHKKRQKHHSFDIVT